MAPQTYTAPSGKTYTVISHNPALYPIAPGQNYRGELQGMIYDPWNDRYAPNPKEQQEYLERMGAADPQPKPPSMAEQTGYMVGGGLIGSGVSWGAAKFADKMGWGSGTTPATPTLVSATRVPSAGGGLLASSGTTPTSSVSAVGTAQGGGLLMSDGSVQGPPSPNVVSAERANIPQQPSTAARVGQGALGAYQGYTGYQQWREGNKLGGGVNMAAGAANVGAAAGSTTAATYVPGLNIAAGAYGMYNTVKGNVRTRNTKSVGMKVGEGAASGAAIGAGIGAYAGGIGAVPGAIIGGIVGGVIGLVRGLWKSGKHQDAYRRDAYRGGLEEMGLADRSGHNGGHAFILSDGTTFDIGQDKTKDENGRTVYELSEAQMKDPRYAFTQAALMPLTNAMGGEGGNIGAEGQTAVMLTKGILNTNHDPATEIKHAYAKALGVDPSQITAQDLVAWIGENYQSWGIDDETVLSYQNAINYWLDPKYDREATNNTFALAADKYFKDNPLDGEKREEEEEAQNG